MLLIHKFLQPTLLTNYSHSALKLSDHVLTQGLQVRVVVAWEKNQGHVEKLYEWMAQNTVEKHEDLSPLQSHPSVKCLHWISENLGGHPRFPVCFACSVLRSTFFKHCGCLNFEKTSGSSFSPDALTHITIASRSFHGFPPVHDTFLTANMLSGGAPKTKPSSVFWRHRLPNILPLLMASSRSTWQHLQIRRHNEIPTLHQTF